MCRGSHSYAPSCATWIFASVAAGNREETLCVYFAAVSLFKFMRKDPKLLPTIRGGSQTHLVSLLSHPYPCKHYI